MALFEIIIKGNAWFVYGFLNGYAEARDKGESVYAGDKYNLTKAHLHASVAETLGIGKKRSRFFFADSEIGDLLEKLKSFSGDLEFEVETVYEVSGLSFEFKFQVYNRDIHNKLVDIIENRSKDITVTDFNTEEIVHEDAVGKELYAPEHDYIFKGQGSAQGPFSSILSFYSRLEQFEQVHLTPMQIDIEKKL